MLDDEQVERYARQIVVPGIGAAGQEKLLGSTVLVAGNPAGCAQAALYLRAAGVKVVGWSGSPSLQADLVLLCDAAAMPETERAAATSLGKPTCWYGTDEDGFTTAVEPLGVLPPHPSAGGAPAALHQAAASDLAALACAILVGLPVQRGCTHFKC